MIHGDTAVVAAVGDVAGARGVYVFERDNATGVWNYTAKLEPEMPEKTMFGISVAITDDESNIVVGSPGVPGFDASVHLRARRNRRLVDFHCVHTGRCRSAP